jgi:replication-associated recombination protein RarA
MKIHPEIEDRITKYFSQGMLNTIFYGGRGVGKHTLVLKMLNSGKHEKEKIRFWEDTGVRFYSTSTYIRFDAKECVRKKANLPKIIEEIGRTRDISADCSKIIYIRYLNYLGAQQEAFRQLVEDTYLTCRYVFTCRNIDSVDPALNSRCFLIRVPTPLAERMLYFTRERLPDVSIELLRKMVDESDGNLNSLKHLTMLHKKISNREGHNTYRDIHKEIADVIINKLKEATSVSIIHSLAEKYHYSELPILDICIRMNDMEKFVLELQKYSAIVIPSLYDTILLFLEISKKCNKLLK